MKCVEFREQIGADPAQPDEAADAHQRACPACAAYARRLRRSEPLIAAALRFDVARARQGNSRPAARRVGSGPRVWAAAASVAAAVAAIWVGLQFVPSHDPVRLATAVENHWQHEPESWVRTDTPVAAAVLEAALGGKARVDLERLHVVSYARSCLVNGRWVPHLVVQGDAGPVMLLLMPKETLAQEQPLDLPEQGLRGTILPVGQGSVAILGEEGEAFESLRREVSSAVEWTI
jgi:Protein of unknown function (DUF3379)